LKTLNCLGNKLETHGVVSVAFDTTYLLASGSSDNTVMIWDKNSGNQLKSLTGHTNEVYAVAFDSNNMLASGSFDKTTRIWNKHNGYLLRTLTGHGE
jgi:WD40 repeat protein